MRANPEEVEQDSFEDAVLIMSKEDREAQSLHIKIENILPRIYVNWTNNSFKEKWEWPQIDPFTGLYVEQSKKKKLQNAAFNQSMPSKRLSSLLKMS